MDPPTPQYRKHHICYRAPCSPRIDGDLGKPFWRDALWTDDFVDIEGDAKPLPRHRTRAKLLWDDDALYIGAQLDEPHVWASLTQRDSIVFHDNDFEVFLNPTGDNHNYYEIEINALNTIFDLFLPKPYRDGGPADHNWNVSGLRSAIKIDGTLNDARDTDRGWSAELAVPWRAFDRHGGVKCPPRDGDQWRLNFSRVQWEHEIEGGKYRKMPNRSEHNWVWSPQGVIDMHRPEQWGYVQFSSIIAGSGNAAFSPDPTESIRDRLHGLYYAQLAFKKSNKRWAGLRELELAEMVLDGDLRFRTAAGSREDWVASIPSPDGQGQWCIRQDSLVWREG